MKNFIKRFVKSKKAMVTAFAVTALAVTGSTVLAGWGMNRPVYDWNNEADRVGSLNGPVLNSFINTPYYGDERAFLDSKDAANTNAGGFADTTNVEDGKEYILRAYIHNNANQDDNASGKGVAKDTKVRFKILSDMGNTNEIAAYVSASNDVDKNGNAVNGEIWDTTALKNTSKQFKVEYVPGSAVLYNKWHANNTPAKLSDEIVNGGVLIGDDQMDGNLNGCFEYQAFVAIKVRIVAPKLELSKKVRIAGNKTWEDKVVAKPGDTLQWMIEAKNTGTTDQHNVVVQELLPPHVEFAPGTAKYYFTQNNQLTATDYNFDQLEISDGDGGYNFGRYSANSNVIVRFDTKVLGDFDTCKMYIRNLAYTKSTENPSLIQDSADVEIDRPDCQPAPKYTCNLLSLTQGENRTVRITDIKKTAENATYNKTVINWGDGQTEEGTDMIGKTHSYAKDGSYTVTATIYFTVNGQTKTATANECAKTVSFNTPTPPAPKYVCQVMDIEATGREVTINKFEAPAENATFKHAVINWGDNTSPLTTNTAVGQKHTYPEDGTFKITATAYFDVNGETKSATSDNCAKSISFKKTVPPQVLATSTPTVMPKTGASEVAMIVAVAVAVILGTIGHAAYSRKADRRN